MSDTPRPMSSAYPANSISFCRTDNKAVFLQINTDGTVIWKGRVVESDADFRAAMVEVHQHMCGSVNGELAKARTALAEVARLTPERDALAAEIAALKAQRDEADAECREANASWCREIEESIDLNRELASMREQRDEARREVCERAWGNRPDVACYARMRGWDCFDAKEGQP